MFPYIQRKLFIESGLLIERLVALFIGALYCSERFDFENYVLMKTGGTELMRA
jgi:hypothetical protein